VRHGYRGHINEDSNRVERALQRLAKETGRSRSFYVNEALQEAIDRFEYEYGILKDIEDYRAGRLETYSIDEVRAHCGLAN
jgi:RHH-type rel operon transcriptional repressor/antitoxin RelB